MSRYTLAIVFTLPSIGSMCRLLNPVIQHVFRPLADSPKHVVFFSLAGFVVLNTRTEDMSPSCIWLFYHNGIWGEGAGVL
jgi:hypothetical protein